MPSTSGVEFALKKRDWTGHDSNTHPLICEDTNDNEIKRLKEEIAEIIQKPIPLKNIWTYVNKYIKNPLLNDNNNNNNNKKGKSTDIKYQFIIIF